MGSKALARQADLAQLLNAGRVCLVLADDLGIRDGFQDLGAPARRRRDHPVEPIRQHLRVVHRPELRLDPDLRLLRRGDYGPEVSERRLVALTGRRARNLQELLWHLRELGGASVFYHTHHLYLSHHFERPRFYNGFAQWIAEALQEKRLAEEVASIDLLAFTRRLVHFRRSHPVFRRPRFSANGSLETPAYVTVFYNGVLVQDHTELLGTTSYTAPPTYERHPERQPISLQYHGNPVRYRNIWVVPREEVEAAAATYLVYYGNHIAREEENVLRLAAQHLSPEDWDAVKAAAPAGKDPLFGKETESRYRELRRQIALEA